MNLSSVKRESIRSQMRRRSLTRRLRQGRQTLLQATQNGNNLMNLLSNISAHLCRMLEDEVLRSYKDYQQIQKPQQAEFEPYEDIYILWFLKCHQDQLREVILSLKYILEFISQEIKKKTQAIQKRLFTSLVFLQEYSIKKILCASQQKTALKDGDRRIRLRSAGRLQSTRMQVRQSGQVGKCSRGKFEFEEKMENTRKQAHQDRLRSSSVQQKVQYLTFEGTVINVNRFGNNSNKRLFDVNYNGKVIQVGIWDEFWDKFDIRIGSTYEFINFKTRKHNEQLEYQTQRNVSRVKLISNHHGQPQVRRRNHQPIQPQQQSDETFSFQGTLLRNDNKLLASKNQARQLFSVKVGSKCIPVGIWNSLAVQLDLKFGRMYRFEGFKPFKWNIVNTTTIEYQTIKGRSKVELLE